MLDGPIRRSSDESEAYLAAGKASTGQTGRRIDYEFEDEEPACLTRLVVTHNVTLVTGEPTGVSKLLARRLRVLRRDSSRPVEPAPGNAGEGMQVFSPFQKPQAFA